MTIAIEPFPGTLIVERCHQDELTEGGIVLPDNVRTDLPYGRVLAVGVPPPDWPGHVELGETVFFPGYVGKELEYNRQKAVVLEYADLIGKLRKEDADATPA